MLLVSPWHFERSILYFILNCGSDHLEQLVFRIAHHRWVTARQFREIMLSAQHNFPKQLFLFLSESFVASDIANQHLQMHLGLDFTCCDWMKWSVTCSLHALQMVVRVYFWSCCQPNPWFSPIPIVQNLKQVQCLIKMIHVYVQVICMVSFLQTWKMKVAVHCSVLDFIHFETSKADTTPRILHLDSVVVSDYSIKSVDRVVQRLDQE